MAVVIEDSKSEPQPLPATPTGWPAFRPFVLGAGAALLAYLCWRILAPFLPALCWAFALALLADPVHAWLLRRSVPRNLAALIVVIVILLVILGPGALLGRALAVEASDIVNRMTSDEATQNARNAIEGSTLLGPAVRWLDTSFDLPKEALQAARSTAGWASAMLSTVLKGSIWLMSQTAVTMFVLFYFLRDGEAMLKTARSLIPLSSDSVDRAFVRIAQTIRVSLAGKFVVASIQGALGGLMFYWLGLPAPVFWGVVMAALSIFPVIGAFVIWLPAALMLAAQGEWKHALILAGWGIAVVHPVDNLLGPVLVGATLRLHTLLMFFSIIGGLAAFGPSGVVLGPVVAAIVVVVFEQRETTAAGLGLDCGPHLRN